MVEVGVLPAHFFTFLDFGRESERLVNLVLQVLRKIAARALVVHHAGVFQLAAEGFEFLLQLDCRPRSFEGFFGLSHAHEGGQVLVFIFDRNQSQIQYCIHSIRILTDVVANGKFAGIIVVSGRGGHDARLHLRDVRDQLG